MNAVVDDDDAINGKHEVELWRSLVCAILCCASAGKARAKVGVKEMAHLGVIYVGINTYTDSYLF